MPEKLRVQEAHDAAVAQINDAWFKLHQTDCAICEDFEVTWRPFRTSEAQEMKEKRT